MNWVLLSFVVVTPMSATIAMAFRRRERALTQIARLRATFLELYAAHSVWDWRKTGKKNSGKAASSLNWLEHADNALAEFLGICDEMALFLSLPNVTRARHRVTRSGRKEAAEVKEFGVDIYDSVLKRMGRVSLLCEVLKEEGLPPNEATRVRQWERIVLEDLTGTYGKMLLCWEGVMSLEVDEKGHSEGGSERYRACHRRCLRCRFVY
jgi:hypothetical protein